MMWMWVLFSMVPLPLLIAIAVELLMGPLKHR